MSESRENTKTDQDQTGASSSDASSGRQSSSPKKRPKTPANIQVRVSWCKGCGLCVDYCPTSAIEMEGVLPRVVDAEKCTRCLQCEAVCPDFAIEIDPPSGGVTAVEKSENEEGDDR
jgi:2-oxoglutarate ferredoxin oxidoreductase subunit delta